MKENSVILCNLDRYNAAFYLIYVTSGMNFCPHLTILTDVTTISKYHDFLLGLYPHDCYQRIDLEYITGVQWLDTSARAHRSKA